MTFVEGGVPRGDRGRVLVPDRGDAGGHGDPLGGVQDRVGEFDLRAATQPDRAVPERLDLARRVGGRAGLRGVAATVREAPQRAPDADAPQAVVVCHCRCPLRHPAPTYLRTRLAGVQRFPSPSAGRVREPYPRSARAVVLVRQEGRLEPPPSLYEAQSLLLERRGELERRGLVEPSPAASTTAQLIETADMIPAPTAAVELM